MDSKKYKVNEVNAWNGWDPLKQVVLGNCFPPEFFEDVKDTKLRDLLQRLLYETREDLQNIQNTLEGLGVEVVRMPEYGMTNFPLVRHESPKTINEAADLGMQGAYKDGKVHGFPKPCLTPRDDIITLGNKCLFTSNLLDNVIEDGEIFNPDHLDLFSQKEWNLYRQGKVSKGPLNPTPHLIKDATEQRRFDASFQFWAPLIHRVGDRLVVDQQDWANLSDVILERYPQFTAANIAVGGHTDGSMNLPKPGLVICGDWMGPEDFKHTLPGWDVLRIEHPNQTKSDFGSWADEKHITQGRWWTPEAKSNPELVDFVDNWLTNWVGYAEESIFEVNMLSVNPETILSLNYQPEVHNALKKHGIEPIYCRFRQRNFWDGGLHCLTVDTVREGGIQSYF